jgi:N-methylhydantoinase A
MARIEVGPDSAGADPGPVCYGRGGTKPAVTDANLLLGRYDPLRFAGGTMQLDFSAARDALLAEVGAPLGLAPEMAALGVIEIVDENMANAARVHAIESGKTYEGRTLVAFGGGGPVHACRLAEKVGISRILVPSGAGVGSAIGFLRAPVGYEVVRSLYQRLSTFDTAAVNELLASMFDEASAVVDQGRLGQPITETRIAFMRYVGQGHEIPVPLPVRKLSADDATAIHNAYEREYAKFFDRPVPGSDVEVMSYAVVLTTATPGIATAPAVTSFTDAQSTQSRLVRDTLTGAASSWAVHDRAALKVGSRITGPAIIVEDETSTIVGPGWRAFVNTLGYIEIIQEAA